MNTTTKTKQLLKILFGAAWIDGLIQTEERDYLHRMAKVHELAEDPEIKSLLSEIKPVKSPECYQWISDYLGDNPSEEDYQGLLEALSGLIYSDGYIQNEEAQLLSKLQLLDPATECHQTAIDKLLNAVQKLYRKAVKEEV